MSMAMLKLLAVMDNIDTGGVEGFAQIAEMRKLANQSVSRDDITVKAWRELVARLRK
jgi:hypothetical protein